MTTQIVSFDTRDFDRAARGLESAAVERIGAAGLATPMRVMANTVRNQARRELRVRHPHSRRMRDHIRPKVYGRPRTWDRSWAVRTTGVGSNLIVGGVRPHTYGGTLMPIYMGSGRFLTAGGNLSRGGAGAGITGFTRSVRHPGFAPDPFFDRGITAAEPVIREQQRMATENMAAGLARHMEGR